MATTITRSPTTVVEYAGPGSGSIPWETPGHAVSSNDQWAIARTPTSGTTRYLEATGFGFDVPTNAKILGVLVECERARFSYGFLLFTVTDAVVRLRKDSGIVGANKAAPGDWPNVDTYANYGGDSDLWNETWTPTEINAPTFGVVLAATVSLPANLAAFENLAVARVDHVRISVRYEAFSEPQAQDEITIEDAVEVEDLSAPRGAVGCVVDFSYWAQGLPAGFLSSSAGDFSYWMRGFPVVHFCTPLMLVSDDVVIGDAVTIETGAVPPVSPGGPTWTKFPIVTTWSKRGVV